MVVAYSILFTWLYGRTAGSLTVAVVFHAAINLFSVADLDPSRQYWLRAAVYSACAAVVILLGGLRGVRGKPTPERYVSDTCRPEPAGVGPLKEKNHGIRGSLGPLGTADSDS
jgi:hypothetical protein